MNGSRNSTSQAKKFKATHPKRKSGGGNVYSAPAASGLIAFATSDLAPPPQVGNPDNLLKASTQGKDLILTIPYPRDSELYDGDTIALRIDGVILEDERFVITDPDADTITMVLRQNHHNVSGPHAIGYQLRFDSGGTPPSTEEGPAGQSFIVDYDRPGVPDLASPEFFFDPATGLTPEKLNPDGSLSAHVYGYTGLALEDVLYGTVDGVPGQIARVDDLPAEGEPIQVTYSAEQIKNLSDTSHTFSYYVQDRAGNISPIATPVTMPILLEGFIDDLTAPLVPEADDDLIDDADARLGDGAVTVLIPANARLNDAYTAIVHWGDSESAPVPVPPGPQDPSVTLGIPYGTVYADWFTGSAGADQVTTADVYYELMRNGVFAGKSPPTTVKVNLALPGGEDPDPLTPVHDDLSPPIVLSSSGKVDLIPIDDFGQEGTVSISFQTVGNPPPAHDVFVENDVIEVQYGSTVPFSHTVTADEIDAAIPIAFPLPADNITAGGAGTVAVSYTITRDVAGGGKNTVLSPAKNVTVRSSSELPGGGQTLTSGSWKESERPTDPTKADLIGPVQAKNGVTIELPLYSNKKVGDVITVDLVIYPSFRHNEGEVAVPGRVVQKTVSVGAPDVGGINQVVFTYSELIYINVPPLTTHAHIVYKVRGIGQDVDVGSEELILRIDSRGDGLQ